MQLRGNHWAPGAVILLVWALVALWQYAGQWPGDLSALYFAGHFFAEGDLAQVYASPIRFFGNDYPASWQAYGAALGHSGDPVYPFIYPPIWAWLFAPLARSYAPEAVFGVARAIEIGALIWSVVLAHRLWGQGISFTLWAAVSVALLATSVIGLQALVQAQPQIIVTWLILLAFERTSSGRPGIGGAVLALAAAIKLTPVLLIVIFIVNKDRRAVISFLVTGLALAFLSLILAGVPLHFAYLEKIAIVGAQLPLLDFSYSAQAVIFEIKILIDEGSDIAVGSASLVLATAPGWLRALAITAMVAGFAWVILTTRGQPKIHSRAVQLVSIYTIVALSMPIAWAHHFLLPLLALPALGAISNSGRGWLAVFAAGAILSKFSLIVTAYDNAPLHFHSIAGAVIMAVLAFAFARLRSKTP